MVLDSLYFGTAKPGRIVTSAEWSAFLHSPASSQRKSGERQGVQRIIHRYQSGFQQEGPSYGFVRRPAAHSKTGYASNKTGQRERTPATPHPTCSFFQKHREALRRNDSSRAAVYTDNTPCSKIGTGTLALRGPPVESSSSTSALRQVRFTNLRFKSCVQPHALRFAFASAAPVRFSHEDWKPFSVFSSAQAQVRCCSLTCSLPFVLVMIQATSSGMATTLSSAQCPLASPRSSSTTCTSRLSSRGINRPH